MDFSKRFVTGYDLFMYVPEKFFLRRRRSRLLSGLSGKVLEIGVGTGVNFRYYNHAVDLTGIEPSPFMLTKAVIKRDLLLLPNRFTLHNTGCGYPEMEKLIVPGSFDAIVCTLVLCTIPDPNRALSNFMKWLKPGGRLLILEHIRSHNRLGAKLQDMLNPCWGKISEGCQLNRPTDRLLAGTGFRLKREDRFSLGIPFYEAEFENVVP
jgi:SAM-dependent methyltransferase